MADFEQMVENILASLLLDFRNRDLKTQDLENGYVGMPMGSLKLAACGNSEATDVNFDLALKNLESRGLVAPGPMEPFRNDPGSQIFVAMLVSRREYVYITEEGFKAAQRTSATRRNLTRPSSFHASGKLDRSPVGTSSEIDTTPTTSPTRARETHGAGTRTVPSGSEPDSREALKQIFVIHGRDERLREGMFVFLRALGLEPLEWTKAIQLTGKASPYIGEILESAFKHARAVVVLLTPDDEAKLRDDLIKPADLDHERFPTGQARPNVLFEAGMALASHPDRTVLVQFGTIRPFSDIAGRHAVTMDNSVAKRHELAVKLKTAGCPVDLERRDWQTSGDLNPPVRVYRPDDATHRAVSPAPNLTLLGVKSIRVASGQYASFYETTDNGQPWAAVACFRNEASMTKKTVTVNGVRACLVYRDHDGREIGTGISRACWLGDPAGDLVDFPVGQTQCVILAIAETNGQLVNPYRRRTRAHWGEGITTERYVLDQIPKTIEIKLLSDDELLLEPIHLRLDVSQGRPSAEQL